jgi:hypothetical protein
MPVGYKTKKFSKNYFFSPYRQIGELIFSNPVKTFILSAS